ncbi:hypothetical protein AB0B71_15880 [Micromonospora echinofusca]|uniref:phospholipase D-like domain-containing protein n=1 Tax=Micromonospora echinofusca TaxID=47858 RepID=UPI0034110466
MDANRFLTRLATRSALVLATVLAASGVPALCPAPAIAAGPDPVLDKPVFSRPLGSVAEQNAIFIQLGGIIDRVPAGEEIQMSWFHFSFSDVTDSATTPDIPGRLISAYQRGVRVKIIVDQSSATGRPFQRLQPVLGSTDNADSYIVHCADRFPSQDRGCIGTRAIQYTDSTVTAYNHNKFLTASRIVLGTGASVSNVVFQGSANLTWWDANSRICAPTGTARPATTTTTG